jgi:hypothetical protein
MDENAHDAPTIVIIGWLTLGLNTLRSDVQQDYDYHFPNAGPPFPGLQRNVPQGWVNPSVSALFKKVTDKNDPKGCDPKEFGKFLHMLADSWSHGGGVPDGFGHPKGVRIFVLELDENGNFQVENLGRLNAKIKGHWETSRGLTDTRVDDPMTNWEAWNEAKNDIHTAVDEFKKHCPCACACGEKDE